LQDLYGFSHGIHGQWNKNLFSLNGPNLDPFQFHFQLNYISYSLEDPFGLKLESYFLGLFC
jgi:hypothetical protein